jgi:TolC family type I secretion outer membrane protein
LGLSVAALGAQATELSFGQAFEAALAYDPSHRGAAYALEASRLGEPIARAALLPSIALSAAQASVRGTRSYPNAFNQDVRVRLDYEAPQANLSVRMPILNFEGHAGLRQAQAETRVAEEQFRTDGLDLVDRLSAAYIQLLAAQETRRLLAGQVDSLDVQLVQAERRQARGEDTRVRVAQAQADLALGRSRLIDADSQLAVAKQAMARIVGLADVSVPGLADASAPTALSPDALTAWIELALRNSPLLRLREQVVEVTKAVVRRQYAGHLPRLDAVGSVSQQESDSTANIGQTSNLRSIGLQLSVPIFNGGGVDASVKQALARQMQAEEELRFERETLQYDVQRFWQAAVSGEVRIRALEETLRGSALALRGAERSLEEGLGTAGQVAELRSAYLRAERELLQARLDHLQARVRLQLRSGASMTEVVTDFDRLWTSSSGLADSGVRP